MGDDWARPVVHWEIEALDAERQRAFYGELFNWEIGDGPDHAHRSRPGWPRAGSGGSRPAGRTQRGRPLHPGS